MNGAILHAAILPMIRWFLVLALLGCGALVAGWVVGSRAALAGGVLVGGLHLLVCAYLAATGRRAREFGREQGHSDRFVARSERNWRRALPFALLGGLLALASAGMAVVGDPGWQAGASAMAIGFNVGAFAVEALAIAGQDRLFAEGR